MRAVDNWTETHTDAFGPPNVNVTIANKAITFDPFDSYSILKPAERDWLIPKPSRRPFVIAALLVVIMVGGVVAFSGGEGGGSLSTEAVNSAQAGRINAISPPPPPGDVPRAREQTMAGR